LIFDRRVPSAECSGSVRVIPSIANRNSRIENWMKGGEPHVA